MATSSGTWKAFKNVKFIKTHQKLSISYQDNNLYLSRAAGTYYIYIYIRIIVYIYIYAQQLWAKTHISCVCSQQNACNVRLFFHKNDWMWTLPKETSGCIWVNIFFLFGSCLTEKTSFLGTSKFWHTWLNPEVHSSHFWNRTLITHLVTFQQNLDEFGSILWCSWAPKTGLENAWHNQFVSWYQSSSCLENNLIWKDELGPGYGAF